MTARDDNAERMAAYRRALRPAGGTVSREQLEALGDWAKPRDRSQTRAWALRVRELLAESPGRDLASAALQARGELAEAQAKRRVA